MWLARGKGYVLIMGTYLALINDSKVEWCVISWTQGFTRSNRIFRLSDIHNLRNLVSYLCLDMCFLSCIYLEVVQLPSPAQLNIAVDCEDSPSLCPSFGVWPVWEECCQRHGSWEMGNGHSKNNCVCTYCTSLC